MVGSPTKEDDMSLLPEDIPVDEYVTSYHPDCDNTGDSSFTMASSMYDFSYEHGRRYSSYRYGSQPFPHDELFLKNDRIFHHMLLYLFDNRLFLAPVQNPQNVLDVHCTQGLWVQNMADAYPDSQIVGMDTTPIPNSTHPNISFVVQSFDDEWVLDIPDMKFDFIYARGLSGASGDLDLLYQQAFDNMKPGAYFEQIEIEIAPHCDDNSLKPDSAVRNAAELTPSISNAFGTEWNIAVTMRDRLPRIGFVDVQETRLKLPLGPWSADSKYKQVGEWFEAYYKSGLQGWLLAPMTRKMGVAPEKVNEFCEAAFREIDEREQHVYFMAYVVHCRKPG